MQIKLVESLETIINCKIKLAPDYYWVLFMLSESMPLYTFLRNSSRNRFSNYFLYKTFHRHFSMRLLYPDTRFILSIRNSIIFIMMYNIWSICLKLILAAWTLITPWSAFSRFRFCWSTTGRSLTPAYRTCGRTWK